MFERFHGKKERTRSCVWSLSSGCKQTIINYKFTWFSSLQ